MANYIKNEVLCEAYSHLEVPVAANAESLQQLKNDMNRFFTERARFLFGEEVQIEIEFEEGSLITRLRVVGSAALIIAAAVANYGTFRESVGYLKQDATLLAQSANLEMVFRTKAAHCDRIRIEKRQGVFGRVDELISELDRVKNDVLGSSLPRNKKAIASFNESATDKLIDWETHVHILFGKFDHDNTRACVAAGFLEELERFPDEAPWSSSINDGSFRSQVANSNSAQAGALAAASARYTATVTKLRSNFSDLVKQYAPVST